MKIEIFENFEKKYFFEIFDFFVENFDFFEIFDDDGDDDDGDDDDGGDDDNDNSL